MKLFVFFPNDYCRMYILGESQEDLESRADELFLAYMKDQYSYYDLDDVDDTDEINDKKQYFLCGLEKAKELPGGIAIDSHY